MWELVKKVAGKGENQETDDGVSLSRKEGLVKTF